ncbi:MAG: 2-hydroxy-acid oxidase, partial [Rhizobiaceae bacterium]
MTLFTAATSDDILAAILGAVTDEQPIEIVGHGSKRGIGRAAQAAHMLDLYGLSGVTLYEPAELVLSARTRTPLAENEKLLAD